MGSLLIYSGGLDSTSALYVYKEEIKLAVSFNYGSRHNKEELKRASWNCKHLGVEHIVVNLQEAFKSISSALLGDGSIPHGHYEHESMKATVVPFRNAIMLSIATGIAESKSLDGVMLASHKGDNAVYPDCRPEFNKAMGKAMEAGTYDGVRLLAPFELLDKKAVAEMGIAHGMDPTKTYSCYEGGPIHCDKCSTCIERLWALGLFTDAEVEAMK